MTAAGGGSAEKAALRQRLLTARAALPPEQLAAARREVTAEVLAGLPAGIRIIACYRPLRTEPGSVELLAALAARGLRVLVPVTRPDRDLDWVDLADHRFGPDAIADADLVLVPALAVGPAGERLGRGGGSYDRALPRARGPLVALLHRGELLAQVPVDPWDVAVQAAVTPDGWAWLR